ncbi:unnamed protein product, partial [Prunus brigantina]
LNFFNPLSLFFFFSSPSQTLSFFSLLRHCLFLSQKLRPRPALLSGLKPSHPCSSLSRGELRKVRV